MQHNQPGTSCVRLLLLGKEMFRATQDTVLGGRAEARQLPTQTTLPMLRQNRSQVENVRRIIKDLLLQINACGHSCAGVDSYERLEGKVVRSGTLSQAAWHGIPGLLPRKT